MHQQFSITCLVQNSLVYLRMFHMVSVSLSLVLEAIKHPFLPPSCRHPWISESAPLHILQTSTLIERVLSPAQFLSEGLPYVASKEAFGNFQSFWMLIVVCFAHEFSDASGSVCIVFRIFSWNFKASSIQYFPCH